MELQSAVGIFALLHHPGSSTLGVGPDINGALAVSKGQLSRGSAQRTSSGSHLLFLSTGTGGRGHGAVRSSMTVGLRTLQEAQFLLRRHTVSQTPLHKQDPLITHLLALCHKQCRSCRTNQQEPMFP